GRGASGTGRGRAGRRARRAAAGGAGGRERRPGRAGRGHPRGLRRPSGRPGCCSGRRRRAPPVRGHRRTPTL
ncbi:MAG: hypothetical protein AVDCRST_MAG20-427, partial [uncultured Acidimicrobiales bacterium]